MGEVKAVWKSIRCKSSCDDCPLKELSFPLLFDGECVARASVMVVSEGPNEVATREFIASIANHPTFTFLSVMFGCNFKPWGEGANVYWTHVRKCFLRKTGEFDFSKFKDDALEVCAYKAKYLKKEIEAMRPRLILAVGRRAVEAIAKYSGDDRLRGSLEDLVFKRGGVFEEVKVGACGFTVAVVPHPSGLNTVWAGLAVRYPEAHKVLKRIQSVIIEALG